MDHVLTVSGHGVAVELRHGDSSIPNPWISFFGVWEKGPERQKRFQESDIGRLTALNGLPDTVRPETVNLILPASSLYLRIAESRLVSSCLV